MQKHILFEDDDLKWIVLCRDDEKSEAVIDSNQYIVVSGDETILLDPGGTDVFPQILTTVSSVIDVRSIKAFMCSHQDPDVMSSLPLWLGLAPKSKIYLPWLWKGFVAHFGSEYVDNLYPLPDEGEVLTLGNREFRFIPAHHCHSAGNFSFFDPTSKILFSGDIGAALTPENYPIFVEDFADHIQYMEGFHRRWMPSQQALNVWIEHVKKLNPTTICPQHGSIFNGIQVQQFLDWLSDLEVGQVKRYIA